jgi:hypothetical protein
MSKILADGIAFDVQDYLEDALSAQPALIEARQKQGHALCTCTIPHRQLVIREVNGVLYLAVWPHDGQHHDPSCEFYRSGDESETPDSTGLPSEISNKSDGATGKATASSVTLNPDGTWTVALDIPAPKGYRQEPVTSPAMAALPTADRETGAPRDPSETLSLPQFLSWLWNNTSMNHWGKGWRRDWWRVAQSIRTEAQAVVIEACRLNDLLYIPPPFVKEHQAQIHAGWDHFVAPLMASAKSRGAQQRGFVLLEVKAIDRTEYGFKVLGRNLARPIFVDEHLHAAIARHSPLALALLPKSRELSCAVLGLFVIEATERGNLRAVAAALMVTNSRYIPVSTLYELKLANAMCAADRTFTRGVGKHQGADFVLRDTHPSTAMVIYSLQTPDYVRKRDKLAEACAQAGCTIWKWNPGADQELPALPPVS